MALAGNHSRHDRFIPGGQPQAHGREFLSQKIIGEKLCAPAAFGRIRSHSARSAALTAQDRVTYLSVTPRCFDLQHETSLPFRFILAKPQSII
jgi:hypothetical protein